MGMARTIRLPEAGCPATDSLRRPAEAPLPAAVLEPKLRVDVPVASPGVGQIQLVAGSELELLEAPGVLRRIARVQSLRPVIAGIWPSRRVGVQRLDPFLFLLTDLDDLSNPVDVGELATHAAVVRGADVVDAGVVTGDGRPRLRRQPKPVWERQGHLL